LNIEISQTQVREKRVFRSSLKYWSGDVLAKNNERTINTVNCCHLRKEGRKDGGGTGSSGKSAQKGGLKKGCRNITLKKKGESWLHIQILSSTYRKQSERRREKKRNPPLGGRWPVEGRENNQVNLPFEKRGEKKSAVCGELGRKQGRKHAGPDTTQM